MGENLSPGIVCGRVPISQRIVPVVSFVLTAAGGMLCSWWTLQLFRQLKNDKTATVTGLMNRLGSISETVGLIYVFAVIIGVIGIAVIFMRSDDDEATLPGFAFLAGILTLISPALSAYALYIEIAVFHTSEKSDFAKVGGQIAELGIYSIIVGAVALVVVSPIAFLPFSARVGKRLSPIFGIGSVLIGTMILVAITFWLVGFSQEPTNPVFGK